MGLKLLYAETNSTSSYHSNFALDCPLVLPILSSREEEVSLNKITKTKMESEGGRRNRAQGREERREV